MSLDKAIAAGKERRKPYRGSERFDRSCRHGGDCPYCVSGRKHPTRKREVGAVDDLQNDLPTEDE